MAKRKVLQEIPVFPPQAEEQSFVAVPEETIPDACHPFSSFPPRAHAKYISNDESKENITPADFDTITKETYKYEKSDVGKPVDLMEPKDLGDVESSGSGSHVKDGVRLEMAAGGESITPSKDANCSDWRIGASDTPLDFSQVTVDDFGISSESFTNSVGRSPRSLHKHRRRSTIGVRGSPEMNFLIRQIALQRSKRKSIPEPPSNPFISPRNSILKEKMSSFRNAFQAVEESEGKLPFPGFTEDIEETTCVTQGSNIYGNTCEIVEPPKRKRVCDASLSEMKSVPVMSHPPLLSTQTQKTTQEIEQVPVMEKISESEDASASRLFSAASKSVNLQNEEIHPVPSSTRGRKRKVMFADLLSPPESKSTLCHNQTLKFDFHTSSSPVLRPVLKKITSKELMSLKDELRDQRVCFSVTEPLENENNTLFKKTVSDSVKRRKKVTFGRELSPELFDKTLPANTPLRKGSTPYRQHATDTATPTAQETVHQSPCQSLTQPDFDCRDDEDTFKPLSLCFDTGSPSQDSDMLLSSPGKNDQFLPIEDLEDETQENSHKEDNENLQISYNFPENTTTAAALGAEIVNESFIASEPDIPANSIVTRSSNKSKQACSSEDLYTSDNSQTADTRKVQLTTTTKQSSKRGRKPVLVKCVQVKVPRSKGKKGRGKPKKSIQKPLYGEREMASKKPLLSPIPELPECYPTPPASVHVSHGGTLKKGLVKRVPKRKGIQRVQKSKGHVDLFSGSVNLKVEDVTEDLGCPEQEDLAGKHTEPLSDSQEHTEPDDLVVQVVTLSAITEYPLSADKEIKQYEECIPESGEGVPEDKSTIDTITALKPQNKSKRRSTTRRKVSQTTTELPIIANTETPTVLIENLNDDHNTKPERDLLVEDQAQLLELPAITDVVTGRKGRRSSRNYRKAAIFCPSTEPNIHTQDPCAMLPHADENSTTFTIEPCLPIDEILQFTGTEKKVRRSMRLHRDSGASGLFWVQEKTSTGGNSRRKSLSSALQPLGNSNLFLESVSYSPNKEQLPSAGKRRSLSSAVQSVESSRRILENVTYSPNKEQLNIHQLPNAPERRSLSSAVQSLESSERFLENVSPSKERMNVQQVPSESKKTRRRTLCISSLQQASSPCDPKRRRSNVYYRNSYVPSAETQTCHNNIMIDT